MFALRLTAPAIAALAAIGPAHGATATVLDLGQVAFVAASGEVNDVRVATEGAPASAEVRITFTDGGAVVEPGAGCVAEAPNQVSCVVLRDDALEISVELGDGSDVVSAAGACGGRICLLHGLGGSGDDRLVGSAAADDLDGGVGDDVLDGGAGVSCARSIGCYGDSLFGREGTDMLDGGPGPDRLFGGGGADSLRGGPGSDEVAYWDARTSVRVDFDGIADDGARDERDNVWKDVESVVGGRGADTLVGDRRRNILSGGPGADRLFGFGGNDLLVGEGGRDRITGGAGNDLIVADDGKPDVLHGGPGRDRARVDLRLDRRRSIERLLPLRRVVSRRA